MFGTIRTESQEQASIQRGNNEVWRQELVPDSEIRQAAESDGGGQRVRAVVYKRV